MSEARGWKLVDTFLLMSLEKQRHGASEGGVLFKMQNFQTSVTQLPLSPSLALWCAHGQGYFVSGETKLPRGPYWAFSSEVYGTRLSY